jgi:hypothetical protein
LSATGGIALPSTALVALGEREIPAAIAILVNLLVAKRIRVKDVELALPPWQGA